MRRTLFASIVLSAVIVPATTVLAQDTTGRGSPPPTRPGGGGTGGSGGTDRGTGGEGVRGPRVPGGAREGDRGFGAGKGERGGMRGGDGESVAWLKAIDDISRSLTPDQAKQLGALKSEWTAKQEEWKTGSGQKVKELQQKFTEARKAGGTPDPAQQEEMKKLMESKPKFDTFRRRMSDVLTREQRSAHQIAFEKQLANMQPMEKRKRDDGGAGAPDPRRKGASGGDAGKTRESSKDRTTDKPTDKPTDRSSKS